MPRPTPPTAPASGGGLLPPAIKTLSDLFPDVDGDCFVLLTEKEKRRTKDGKPFYKVGFRDKRREIQTTIWLESPFFDECDESWRVGVFYKIRATVRETNYGTQLELRRLREIIDADRQDGFNPDQCRPTSASPPEAIADEILALAKLRLGTGPLFQMVRRIFKEYRDVLAETAASRAHHRFYAGGLLEHTLSVTKIAVFLADHFCANNPALKKTLSRELVVAGAILHDFGKIFETENVGATPRHTVEGELIGHAILGRDLVRKFAPLVGLDDSTRVRLEHLVLTHSRFADWGAPKPPATLEGMILHYADYADATFSSALAILDADDGDGAFVARNGPFGVPLLKPGVPVVPPPAPPVVGRSGRPSNSPPVPAPQTPRPPQEKPASQTSQTPQEKPTAQPPSTRRNPDDSTSKTNSD